MGNCAAGLSKCFQEIRYGGETSSEPFEPKIDQLLLKRLILLEEKVIEQEMDVKTLKTLLSRLEMRRLEDKEKLRVLANSTKKIKDYLNHSRDKQNIYFKDEEDRIIRIGDAIKDLRAKLNTQGTLLNELTDNDNHYVKDQSDQLIDALEKGIHQGRKHLENLEELFEPFTLTVSSEHDRSSSSRKPKYEHFSRSNTTASSF